MTLDDLIKEGARQSTEEANRALVLGELVNTLKMIRYFCSQDISPAYTDAFRNGHREARQTILNMMGVEDVIQ